MFDVYYFNIITGLINKDYTCKMSHWLYRLIYMYGVINDAYIPSIQYPLYKVSGWILFIIIHKAQGNGCDVTIISLKINLGLGQ